MKSLQHRVSYEQTSCTKPYKKNLFVNLMFVMRFDKNKRSAGTFGFFWFTSIYYTVTRYKIQLNYAVYYRPSSVLKLVKV